MRSDAVSWITSVVRQVAPQAVLCLDPFHIVQWAQEALNEVRREFCNQLRRDGKKWLRDPFSTSSVLTARSPLHAGAIEPGPARSLFPDC